MAYSRAFCKYSKNVNIVVCIICIISANLSVADLAIVVPLVMYLVELLVPELSTNMNFCISRIGISVVSFGASSMTLIHISIDRFMAIAFPFKHFVDSKKMRLYFTMIFLIWISAIIFGLCIYFKNVNFEQEAIPCTNGNLISYQMNMAISCLIFLMAVFTSTLYFGICCKLKTRKKLSHLKASKVAQTNLMILVYACFVVSWLPLGIVNVILLENQSLNEDLFCVREYLTLLAYMNSGVNWIIYGLANQKFRSAFATILCRTCIKQLNGPVPSSTSG